MYIYNMHVVCRYCFIQIHVYILKDIYPDFYPLIYMLHINIIIIMIIISIALEDEEIDVQIGDV